MMAMEYEPNDVEHLLRRANRSRIIWRAAFIGAVIGFSGVIALCCALLSGWYRP